jgi:hypothetical protein
MDMQRLAGLATLIAAGWLVFGAAPERAVAAPAQRATNAAVAQLEVSAQARKPRARTQIRVYPNRNAVRQCVDWYAEERRPSGTVIVPHMRCRWVVRR